MKRFNFRIITTALLALPLATGCGGKPASTTADSTGSSNTNGPTTTTAQTNAPTASVIDGAGTEPAQSVAIFLDSLRRGDETAINSVLTAKSREEIAKTNQVLQPLGTPEGEYKIGRVGFPYSDSPDVALVECTWNEPALPGKPQVSMDIVCEVHKEPEGWRISGMVFSMTGTEDTVVLDFEDANSLEATLEAATGQSAQPAQSTATTNQSPATQNFGNLPELPTYPQGNAPATNFDQIALPPQNDSIRR